VRHRRLAVLAVAAVLLLLFGGRWLAVRYTEHAWFAALGEEARFWRQLGRAVLWQSVAIVVCTGWYAAHVFAVYRSIGSVHLPRRLGNLEIAEAVSPRLLRGIAIAIAGLLGLVTTYAFKDLGTYVAMSRVGVDLGAVEPVLGRDAAFYLVRLPLLETLHVAATVAVIVAVFLSVGLYLLTGNITVSGRRFRFTAHARSHVVVLLCALGLVLAWGFHLDAFQLVGGGGHAEGALSAVDRAVRIPASNALATIALMVAAASALALRWLRPGGLFGVWAMLAVAALLGRIVVPLLAEAWNAAETGPLSRALGQYADDWSRRGAGLTELRFRPLPLSPEARPESAAALAGALAGVSPWSGEPAHLEAAFAAGEPPGDTGLPRTWSVTLLNDQDAGGRPRLIALGVPQTDFLALARRVPRPSWTETHRRAAAWAGAPIALEAGFNAGPPRFFARLAPAETSAQRVSLAVLNRRLRFLPRAAEIGVVSPDEATVGEAPPGIRLRSFGRRLLLAWALQAPPLLSDRTSKADRVLYWRDVPERLARLYPFAAFDAPRATLLDERLMWVSEGYLLGSRFPLARRVRWHGNEVTYVNAAYLATVDAETGETRLYLRGGPHASFAAALARADGVAVLPAEALAAEVRDRLNYPLGLFLMQTSMLARLGEDGEPWRAGTRDTVGLGRDAAAIRPTAALLDLDGTGRRLWWLSALSDAGGNRLVALLAATGGAGAGRLLLLRTDEVPFPSLEAAAARLGGAPDIAAVVATPQGGTVRRGPALVVPAAGTLVYLQALFAAPRAGQPLRLEGVAALAGGRAVAGRDAEAIARALTRPGGADGGAGLLATEALAEARAAFLALDSARATGDWERFGRAWQALRRALRAESVRP
jgi:hypothetical protein